MMKFLQFLFLSLFLLSCKEIGNKNFPQLVKKWNGKEIFFPDNIVFTQYARDTISAFSYNSDYIVVTYVDSIGCTSCKLQLGKWKDLMKEFSLAANCTLSFLFFLHIENLDEMRYVLRRDNFTHPVCIDISDSFNKLNHFPSDVRFQTFLLNKENRVIAIGNPVHNPKIKELYLNIISGGTMARKEKQVQTEVTANETTVDLGEFGWNTSQETIFTLRNTGKSLLVIDDVVTSCGCTSVEYAKEPVRPDKSLDINVVYKADHPEHFNKTIMVYCNAATSPIQLKIQGNAK